MTFFSQHKSSRFQPSRMPSLVLLALTGILFSSSFCGRASRNHSSGATDDITNLIPEDWDGSSDWQGANWTIKSVELARKPVHVKPEPVKARGICDGTPRLNDSGYLMKVRFFQGGELHRLIAANQGLLSTNLRPSPTVSDALLHLRSVSEVEQLSKLSHTHQAGGCAGIELIAEPGELFCQSNIPHTDTSFELTPPVYDETINLSPVKELILSLNEESIVSKMTSLEGLKTRYFAAENAANVSNHVKTMFESAGSGLGSGFQVQAFQHTGIASSQPSIVATYNGALDNGETIVIGAHLDSINLASQNDAPGADDNASGIAILTEVIRIIAEQNVQFKRKIEWHAYAAEEIGLVGSKQIADQYAAQGRLVTAMMQLDMAAYSANGDTKIHLFRDDTMTVLRRSVKDLLTNYLGGNFSDEEVSVAGTSDHKSWRNAGYPTVFPFENPLAYNPNMHSSADIVGNANTPKLAQRMAQLVTAFLAHHAGIISALDEYKLKFSTIRHDDDIKFAILSPDEIRANSVRSQLSADDVVILFAAPENASVIESCGLADDYAHQCGTDRLTSTEIANGPPGRRFFYSIASASTLARAQRSFGYSVNNEPSFAREVLFSRRGN